MHGNRKLNLIFSFDLVGEREREIFSVCHMGNWMVNVDNLAREIRKKLSFTPFKKTIQHFALFPKLIRKMPFF